MKSAMMTKLDAKYTPKKKENVIVNTIAGITMMSFFPLAIVYCFFGILCNG